VLEEGLTQARVASDLDIPESSVCRWVKQSQIDADQSKSGELTTEERVELARLRRENRILKQEREILKNP
jgi:transposase